MISKRLIRRKGERGLTLVELIVTVAILAILAAGAAPIARYKVKRDKERELRYDLCPECRKKFVRDPLGKEAAQKFDFSEN